MELTRNTGTSYLAAAEWDTFHFPEVNTTWVKIVVESVYSTIYNGFKEIEFYHNSCNKGMYVGMYVCMYVCMYECTCIYLCVYVYIYVCMYFLKVQLWYVCMVYMNVCR